MKIDPYNHKEKYLKWKESIRDKIPNISKENSDLIKNYVFDMEQGLNVSSSSQKGARSYIRLNYLRQKLTFFAKKFENRFSLNLEELTEEKIFKFFGDMRSGLTKRKDGKDYLCVADFAKVFKAFWHWHMKINRKKKIEILDITTDLDISKNKPKWVYLTENQVKKLYENAKYKYKILIMFLYDTGIRSPTELINIRIHDLYNDCKELHIREEISKTFGRRIKLMLCSDLLREYIKNQDLKPNDQLFPINPTMVNRYLKRLAVRTLGDKLSDAGKKYSEISMYDFRHCSCCYWLPRYKSESALKYRFGWKKSDKIHYYSELLGMKDTIAEEDILIDVTKTEIEKQLLKSENENKIITERMEIMEGQMKRILGLVNQGVSQGEMILRVE